MTYQFLLKKLIVEKSKILNFQHQNSAVLVKEMDQNQVIPQTDAHIVVGMVE